MSSGFQPSAHADANDYNSLIHTPATAAASPTFVAKRLLASRCRFRAAAASIDISTWKFHPLVSITSAGTRYPAPPSPPARARLAAKKPATNPQKHFQLESRSVRERSPQTCSAESVARILVSLMQHRTGEQS